MDNTFNHFIYLLIRIGKLWNVRCHVLYVAHCFVKHCKVKFHNGIIYGNCPISTVNYNL